MSRSIPWCLLGLVLASAPLRAQYPVGAAGLSWSGSSGATAGSFCWDSDWSCTPDSVSVSVGETVTLTLRGELNAPWILGLAGGTGPCQPVPGILNALLLDSTAVPALAGFLDQPGPILACPAGTSVTSFPFPPVPPGTVLAIQVLTYGAGNAAAFTKAIVVTVV